MWMTLGRQGLRGTPTPPLTSIYTYLFSYMLRSLLTWTEDRIPRWTFYWMRWALTKGAETSEVTETFLEARLDPGFARLMILGKQMAVSKDPLPQKSCPVALSFLP